MGYCTVAAAGASALRCDGCLACKARRLMIPGSKAQMFFNFMMVQLDVTYALLSEPLQIERSCAQSVLQTSTHLFPCRRCTACICHLSPDLQLVCCPVTPWDPTNLKEPSFFTCRVLMAMTAGNLILSQPPLLNKVCFAMQVLYSVYVPFGPWFAAR